jgi:hypothetical protein
MRQPCSAAKVRPVKVWRTATDARASSPRYLPIQRQRRRLYEPAPQVVAYPRFVPATVHPRTRSCIELRLFDPSTCVGLLAVDMGSGVGRISGDGRADWVSVPFYRLLGRTIESGASHASHQQTTLERKNDWYL